MSTSPALASSPTTLTSSSIPGAQKFGAFASERSEQVQEAKKGEFTDYMKLNLACRMIRQCEDGEKHNTLLRSARLLGGFVGAGRIEEEEAVRILMREITKRDIDSEEHALKTIREGLERGKNDPIKDVIGAEQDAQRELLINDGDMSFISSDDEDFRWIDDYANGRIQVGLDTGDEKLDEHFRYKKEFVIVNGHSNVGKTTMMLYLMVNAARRHNWKWVVYFLREPHSFVEDDAHAVCYQPKDWRHGLRSAQVRIQVGERSLHRHQQQPSVQLHRHHCLP